MSRRSKRITRSKYFSNPEDDDHITIVHSHDINSESSKTNNKKRSNAQKIDETQTKKRRSIKKSPLKSKNEGQTIEDENNNVLKDDNEEENEDEDDSDHVSWEEVEEAKIFDPDSYHPELPENLQIEIDSSKKSRKKTDPVETAIQQRINQCRRENQLHMHECCLLLAIYRLQYLSSNINDSFIKALAYSLVDLVPKSTIKIIHWFRNYFTFEIIESIKNEDEEFDIRGELISTFGSRKIKYPLICNLIIVLFFRLRNFMTRLCYLLDPVPARPNYVSAGKKRSNFKSKTSNSKSKTSNSMSKKETENNDEYFWIEIFDDENNKWMCYDIVNQKYNLDNPKELFSEPSRIVTYVLAIDNENYITEVTARYAIDWISCEMTKRRIYDTKWWERTLALFQNKNYSKYQDADKIEFEKIISEVELPKTFGAYKNHPLFVLTRDLLKFQAIYPPDAPPLGFFHEHPVYSRDCVHILKSRETWLRDARTVKMNEKAYKIVTSKFKWRKTMPGEMKEKEMLELFGEWQTEPYKPPVAQNGIVPRNGYGNVDLYQSCMLPIGTVHLQLPGLLRIANKLHIDCAPAIVGFEGTCGNTHPVIDGFVVCAENKSILIDAWKEDQRIQRVRDEEKRIKRILGNWKRLIRGLMIKNKLKIKYG